MSVAHYTQSDSARDRTSMLWMLIGAHIGASWQIWLNRVCAAAMRHCFDYLFSVSPDWTEFNEGQSLETTGADYYTLDDVHIAQLQQCQKALKNSGQWHKPDEIIHWRGLHKNCLWNSIGKVTLGTSLEYGKLGKPAKQRCWCRACTWFPYIIDNVTKIFSTLLVLYCTFMLATLFTFLQNLASFFCVCFHSFHIVWRWIVVTVILLVIWLK